MESKRAGPAARRARGAVVAAARRYREAVRRFEDVPSAATIDALGEAAGAAQSAIFEARDKLHALGG